MHPPEAKIYLLKLQTAVDYKQDKFKKLNTL